MEVNLTQCFEPSVSTWLSPPQCYYSSGQQRVQDRVESQSA